MAKAFFLVGTVSAFLTVAFGAFGAHGLRDRVTPDMLETFQTGVQYQFYHALGLIILALVIRHFGPQTLFNVTGWLFLAGTLLFSGSLYTLVLTGIKQFGMITPIGGLCFLAGWITLLIGGLKSF